MTRTAGHVRFDPMPGDIGRNGNEIRVVKDTAFQSVTYWSPITRRRHTCWLANWREWCEEVVNVAG